MRSFIYLFCVTSFICLLLFLSLEPFAALLCSAPDPRVLYLSHSTAFGLLGWLCQWDALQEDWREELGRSQGVSLLKVTVPLWDWFLLDCPMTHLAAPHRESGPHWKVLAVGLCPACPVCRTQGEGTKWGPHIYVQYLKVIQQIQLKYFPFFCLDKYTFIMTK